MNHLLDGDFSRARNNLLKATVIAGCAACVALPALAARPHYHAYLRHHRATDGVARINVGGMFEDVQDAECEDDAGNHYDDTVTFGVTGAPDTGNATAAFSPNPVHSFVNTTLTVTTTKKTSPGQFILHTTAVGWSAANIRPSTFRLTSPPS